MKYRDNQKLILKLFIDALKKYPRSEKELEDLLKKEFMRKGMPTLKSDSIYKSTKREREYLEALKLIEERDEKYCWYIYVNDLKKNYEAKVNHSQGLIPALERIAGIISSRYSIGSSVKFVSEVDMSFLIKNALDHLRTYPEVWKLREDQNEKRARVSQARENFNNNLMEKLKNEFIGTPIIKPKLRSPQNFVGNNIPSLIYDQLFYGDNLTLTLEGEQIFFGDCLVAKGNPELYNRIESFINREVEDEANIVAVKKNKKIEREIDEASQKLKDEIRKLISRIEPGWALVGECEICARPDVEEWRP